VWSLEHSSPIHPSTGGLFYKGKNAKKFNQKCKNLDVIVLRITKDNKYVNARPCVFCLDMMQQLGIKRVYYSTENGLMCEKITNMVSIQVSVVQRHFMNLYYNYPKDTLEFYKYIIQRKIPKYMKEKNFDLFLKYNLKNIYPDFTIKKKKDKREITMSCGINITIVVY
jgi:hypothetical protein